MIPAFTPKGIIFDMDGVLLLSSQIHEAAYREVLQPFALAGFQYARYAGMRTRDAMLAIAEEHGIRVSDRKMDAMIAAKSRIALERIERENPIAPNCKAVLAALDRTFRLALASSASAATVNAFVNSNQLSTFFECVLSGADVQEAKPSPEIYRLAGERLGLRPDECLVVEDAVSGIQAAKAAGAITWAVLGTHARDSLHSAGADCVIEGIGDLLELVRN